MTNEHINQAPHQSDQIENSEDRFSETENQNINNKEDKNQKDQPSFFKELIKLVLIVVLVVVPIRMYIAQPFIVSGASMAPNFHTSDYLIVDQISYRFDEPARGDIIIFKYPQNTSKFFIKRVVALPGEKITIKNGNIYITNSKYPQGAKIEFSQDIKEASARQNLTKKMEGDQYFVMGDNRKHSLDSRSWGPLEEKYIIGRAFLRLFPFNEIGLFPGKTEVDFTKSAELISE